MVTIGEPAETFSGMRLRYTGQLPAISPDWEATLVDWNYAELSLADEAAVLTGLVQAGRVAVHLQ